MLKRIKNNIIFHNIRQINRLLTRSERTRALWLVVMILLGALLDVGGLAILVPVIMVGADSSIIHSNEILQGIYDTLGFSSDNSFALFLILGTFVFFIAKNALTFYMSWVQTRFAFDVATELARRQFKRYYSFGYPYFKATRSPEIINNILNIPQFFSQSILLNIITLLSEVAVITFIVIGIFVMDWFLFVALIATLVPAFWLLYSTTKNKLMRLGEERKNTMVEAHSRLNNAIFGYVDVKLTNKEDKFLNHYLKQQRRLNNISRVVKVINILPTKSTELFAVLGIVVIYLYALLIENEPAKLFAFLGIFAGAAYRVMPSMNKILNSIMGVKSHQYVLKILTTGQLPEDFASGKAQPLAFAQEIQFRNLTFTYPESHSPALNNVSFSVRKGEKIGIIGESGSGKTTLMKVMLRFFQEQSGGIYVDGEHLDGGKTNGWQEMIGYVQQNVFLMEGSLKANIAFGDEGKEVDEDRVRKAVAQASLERFIAQLPKGIDTPVGEMGSTLSGGQKQRIGIARALYKEASILVFDEATSALDMETEREITEAIENLSDGKMTIFVIAHRITTLRGCDRIIEMRDGKIHAFHDYDTLVAERLK